MSQGCRILGQPRWSFIICVECTRRCIGMLKHDGRGVCVYGGWFDAWPDLIVGQLAACTMGLDARTEQPAGCFAADAQPLGGGGPGRELPRCAWPAAISYWIFYPLTICSTLTVLVGVKISDIGANDLPYCVERQVISRLKTHGELYLRHAHPERLPCAGHVSKHVSVSVLDKPRMRRNDVPPVGPEDRPDNIPPSPDKTNAKVHCALPQSASVDSCGDQVSA